MRSWIGCAALVLAMCGVGCGGSSVEQSQAAAGSAGSVPPFSMTTAGTPAVSAAGIGGQPAAAVAGSGGSMVSVTPPPPSAAGAGGSAPVAGTAGSTPVAGMAGSAGQAAPSGNARLPCDVASVVGRQCLSCHGSPTNLGAPMPLVTYADFHRPAVTDATKQVYELVGMRVVDTQRPMPPRANGKLAAQDQMVLTTWSSQGGPSLPPSAADCGH